jgi:hypothetical protein
MHQPTHPSERCLHRVFAGSYRGFVGPGADNVILNLLLQHSAEGYGGGDFRTVYSLLEERDCGELVKR